MLFQTMGIKKFNDLKKQKSFVIKKLSGHSSVFNSAKTEEIKNNFLQSSHKSLRNNLHSIVDLKTKSKHEIQKMFQNFEQWPQI